MAEMQKAHNELMYHIFKDLLEKRTELWPELASWDYSSYKISPEDFKAKDYGRYCVMHGIEHLFLVAQLRGATRDELVRILKFMMASVLNIMDDASLDICDPTNIQNPYQGTMRLGKFNLSEMRGRIIHDLGKPDYISRIDAPFVSLPFVGLFITQMNKAPEEFRALTFPKLKSEFDYIYISRSPIVSKESIEKL